MKIKIAIAAAVAGSALAVAGCGDSTPQKAVAMRKPSPAVSASTTQTGALPCGTVAALVADQRAQNAALQEGWVGVLDGSLTAAGTDLQDAATAASNSSDPASAQFSTDASQFLSDQSGGLMPGWPSEYGPIEHDIAALAANCGVNFIPPADHTP